jgi:diacylglycerol kinase (ATP)
VQDAVERLRSAVPRPLDLGILELTDDRGARVTRAFINIASFGLGGLLDRIVNQGPKWIGGRAAFLLGTVRASLVYENAPVRVSVDGEPFFEGPIVNVAIANGRYFGGGMKVAPSADPSDGIFEVVAVGDLMRKDAFAFVPKLYRGTHLDHPLVKAVRGREVVAEALRPRPPVLIDLDGETPGRLPLRARVAPSALRIRA